LHCERKPNCKAQNSLTHSLQSSFNSYTNALLRIILALPRDLHHHLDAHFVAVNGGCWNGDGHQLQADHFSEQSQIHRLSTDEERHCTVFWQRR